MVSKIVSSFHLISDKAFQDWGFTFDRFVKIKNKGILHFVFKKYPSSKNKIKIDRQVEANSCSDRLLLCLPKLSQCVS